MAEHNRLATAPALMKKEIKKQLAFLEIQIQSLATQIEQQIQAEEILAEKDRIRQSVPGVGNVRSSTLVSKLPELGELAHTESSALVGVAPFPPESGGKYKGKKKSCRGGRNCLRKSRSPATLSATRCNPVITKFYGQRLEKEKLSQVALIAGAGKLIIFLNSIVKNNLAWNPKVTQVSA